MPLFPYLIGFLVQFPQEKKYYIPALISLSFFVLLAGRRNHEEKSLSACGLAFSFL